MSAAVDGIFPIALRVVEAGDSNPQRRVRIAIVDPEALNERSNRRPQIVRIQRAFRDRIKTGARRDDGGRSITLNALDREDPRAGIRLPDDDDLAIALNCDAVGNIAATII